MPHSSRSTSAASGLYGDDFRCRLCLRAAGSELHPLFPPGEDQIELLSRIFDCLAIHVSFLYDFNSMMCAECREKIEGFYLFRKQCQSNDEYIRRKRSNLSVGSEFERKDVLLASVKEPEMDALMKEVKDIFGTGAVEKQEEPEDIKMPELAPAVTEHEVIEVPSSSGQSNESFCGFSMENYSRRSPRIFIQNSITEATERQQKPPTPEIHDDAVLPKLTKIKPGRPRGHIPKKAPGTPTRVKQHRRRAVIYYKGYQFSRPKGCPTGGFQWSCCKTQCPVKLNDENQQINAGPHLHRPHVIREGTITNAKRRRRVPFLLAKFGRCLSLVYDNAYRYQYARDLANGQQVWICEAAQTDGCAAYLKIVGDFSTVTSVYKHNHPDAKMILEEKVGEDPKEEV